ncbi:hypothetical protein NKL07_00105 [Mesorhizobium sp. C280B]|uniref:hypothetical protein n=1 Tax=unclassified Mesorhizobium TaxID=325217 RepID=UPI0004CE3840|nr:hypothetical protein [Mesorhizobium sp. LSJC280B00]
MADIGKESLQRDQPVAQADAQSHAKTRLIRAAKNPSVAARDGVCPEHLLSGVQKAHLIVTQQRARAFNVADRMYGLQRCSQDLAIDLLLGPPPLESCLGFDFTHLDRVAA